VCVPEFFRTESTKLYILLCFKEKNGNPASERKGDQKPKDLGNNEEIKIPA
jgi:hypothetical protein